MLQDKVQALENDLSANTSKAASSRRWLVMNASNSNTQDYKDTRESVKEYDRKNESIYDKISSINTEIREIQRQITTETKVMPTQTKAITAYKYKKYKTKYLELM